MRIRVSLLALLCLTVLIISTGCGTKKEVAKPVKFEVTHLSKSTGLPEENITSLVAFAGKIWAGSRKGLYAYDGVNWAIYQAKNVNSLGSNIIENLTVHDNKLWVATDNGACYNDGNRFMSFFTNGRARACIGAGGEVIVGTANGIVLNSSSRGKNDGLVENEVTELCYDSKGNLVIGTRAGISKLEQDMFMNFTGPAKTLMGSSLIEVPPSPANCQLSGNNIKVLLPFKNFVAIGSTCGLTLTDLKGRWETYKSAYEDFVQKGDGSIVKEMIEGNCDMPGNIVNSLAKTDGDEILFVGTDKGLAILLEDKKWADVDLLVPELPKLNVTGVAFLNNDLFVSSGSGIYKVKDIGNLVKKVDKEKTNDTETL